MSLPDFVQAVQALYSPYSDQATRHSADQWLTAFKRTPGAWAVAQQALEGPGLDATLQAAQLLAWKSKKQLAQLGLPQQSALVELLLAHVVAGPAQGAAPLRRALCVALANLAIQCTDWVRPLETLGPRLPQATMVEFLTVLPQECEDAAAAVQSGTAEQAFHLKQRVREWCVEVLAWLYGVHSAAMQAELGGQQQPPSLEAAVLTAGGAEVTVPLVQCFAAWVKWGCLQYIEPAHGAYFTQAAGALLAGPAALQAAGVDAMSEVIEHASEALAPLLVDLVLLLPPRVEQAVQSGEGGGELSHVFGLFCGTHQRVCVGDTPQGQALRQGLLRLLALPRPQGPADEDVCEAWSDAVLPVVDAAYEVVEYMLRLSRGEEEEEDTSVLAPRAISAAARLEFCSAVLGILLQQLQPFASAFTAPPGGGGAQAWGGGSHPPEGVPQTVRDEAEVVMDVLAEVVGGDFLMQRLQAAVEGALAQHGVHSVQAAMVLDVSFYCLRCGSGVYGSHHHRPGQPSPAWFQYMLRLYSLASEVAPGPQGGAPAPPVSILDFDLLSSITALAPALIPLLAPGEAGGSYAGVMDLVLSRALHAVSAPLRMADVSQGSTTDATDAAADAVRAICSFATSAGFQTSESMLSVVEQLLQLLQQPSHLHAYQAAHQQVVVALVHAAEGIPPANEHLLQRAATTMQSLVFSPLTAAVQQVQQELTAAGQPGSGQRQQQAPGVTPAAPAVVASAAAWRLQWALKQVQALLNALELYQVYEDPQDGRRGTGSPAAFATEQQGSAAAGSAGLLSGAVAAFLACWQWLVCACHRPLPPDVYQELSLCVMSCISLDPRTFEPALGSLADLAAACFFMPGGSQLGQALCRAVEAYGAQPRYQAPLLGMLSSLLATPQAQAVGSLRGGDADPEAAQALLSLVACTLRQAASWQQQPAHNGSPHPAAAHAATAAAAAGAITPVLSHALRLAVANAACNHRDVSQRAVGVLSSLAVLALEWGSAMGAEARAFVRARGSGVVQGMIMALMSLNSAAHLPKVVSLMGDVALLAAACAMPQQQQQQQQAEAAAAPDPAAVHAAASQLLSAWLAEAQAGLAAAGVLSQEAAASLLAQLDWQGVLRQATVQVVQRQQEQAGGKSGVMGSPGGVEVRRALQRSLRLMADAIKQAGLCA